MIKSFSILILPKRGTRIQKLAFSRTVVRCLLVAAVAFVGLSGWLLEDYYWLRSQVKHDQTLRTEASIEVKSLRAELQEQRERLTSLQDRVDNSQQLLANWKGLREKIQAALPRARRASFVGNGQSVVQELETSLTSIEGQLEGLITSMPTRWPTQGWVSSGFGRRPSPFGEGTEYHTGLDIANHRGTPVYASGDAVVRYAGYSSANGNSIVLDHGQGITTQYGHLSKILVKRGAHVERNQQIAKIGSTGKSTAPHLHYEVRINHVPIDPKRFLPPKPPMT